MAMFVQHALALLSLVAYGGLALPWPPSVFLPAQNLEIKTIYLVSSCHLDVGFADTAANIINRYFDHFYTEAIQLADELKQGGREQLVFTTHSYLVSMFLDCPDSLQKLGVHCPSQGQKDALVDAIKKGYITWHAYPFNTEPEVYDRSMAEFGFEMTHHLDDKLQRARTRTMSQRDVPGLTRAMIPLMAKHGIDAITVGVNTASMPPAVPTAFIWRDDSTNTEVVGMWHPRGYGGSLMVNLQSMVIVPGMPYALAFAIRGDNSGPPSEKEVILNYAALYTLFPKAEVVASGYDQFVEHLLDYKHLLPVYTQEIGDTWIHGVASDPLKTTLFRSAQRLRSQCLADGQCSLSDNRFFDFSRQLIKYGEHTWGKDVKVFLHDFSNWTNEEFHPQQYSQPNYLDMTSSWMEQRTMALDSPLTALKDHPLKDDIEQEWRSLVFDGNVAMDGFEEGCLTDGLLKLLELKTAEADQGIHLIGLQDKRSHLHSVDYASLDHPLGQVIYETFTGGDFKTFLNDYLLVKEPFAYLDLGKTGLRDTSHLRVTPVREACWHKVDHTQSPPTVSLLLKGAFMDSSVASDYGGPQKLYLLVDIPDITDPEVELPINFTLFLINKTATRIPESLSLFFNPTGVDSSTLHVSKLGQFINVSDVIKNGSQHVHASDNGVRYMDSQGSPLTIRAWDTALVSIGGTNVFPTPMAPPDPSQGVGFNIFNNIWGTNYIMWWPYRETEKSSMFRFTMVLPPVTTPT